MSISDTDRPRFEDIPKAEALSLLFQKLEILMQYDSTCVILDCYGEVMDAWGDVRIAYEELKRLAAK